MFLYICPLIYIYYTLSNKQKTSKSYIYNFTTPIFLELEEPSKFKIEKYSIAISGGSYRSAVISIGALRALWDYGLFARNEVSHISCVSGGCLTTALFLYRKEDAFNIKTKSIITDPKKITIQNLYERIPESDFLSLFEKDITYQENLSKSEGSYYFNWISYESPVVVNFLKQELLGKYSYGAETDINIYKYKASSPYPIFNTVKQNFIPGVPVLPIEMTPFYIGVPLPPMKVSPTILRKNFLKRKSSVVVDRIGGQWISPDIYGNASAKVDFENYKVVNNRNSLCLENLNILFGNVLGLLLEDERKGHGACLDLHFYSLWEAIECLKFTNDGGSRTFAPENFLNTELPKGLKFIKYNNTKRIVSIIKKYEVFLYKRLYNSLLCFENELDRENYKYDGIQTCYCSEYFWRNDNFLLNNILKLEEQNVVDKKHLIYKSLVNCTRYNLRNKNKFLTVLKEIENFEILGKERNFIVLFLSFFGRFIYSIKEEHCDGRKLLNNCFIFRKNKFLKIHEKFVDKESLKEFEEYFKKIFSIIIKMEIDIQEREVRYSDFPKLKKFQDKIIENFNMLLSLFNFCKEIEKLTKVHFGSICLTEFILKLIFYKDCLNNVEIIKLIQRYSNDLVKFIFINLIKFIYYDDDKVLNSFRVIYKYLNVYIDKYKDILNLKNTTHILKSLLKIQSKRTKTFLTEKNKLYERIPVRFDTTYAPKFLVADAISWAINFTYNLGFGKGFSKIFLNNFPLIQLDDFLNLKSFPFAIGDSGVFDNLGIGALLRRKRKRIILLNSPSIPFSKDIVLDKRFKTFDGGVSSYLSCFFGYQSSERVPKELGVFGYNKVFPEEKFEEYIEKMKERKMNGDSSVVELKNIPVEENKYLGVEGGWKVESLIIFYLDADSEWLEELNPEVREEICKLGNFPFFSFIGQQKFMSPSIMGSDAKSGASMSYFVIKKWLERQTDI